MFEPFVVAFTAFFATVAPIDVAALFAALTARATAPHRRAMALKGVAIASGILVVFALGGNKLLEILGITLPALRTAGGILLLLIAVDMVFARPSGGVTTTDDEDAEAAHKRDISVFPLATPLIAGPGAMGAAMLLTADAQGDATRIAIVVAALAAVMAITLALLLAAAQVSKFVGVTAQSVIARVVGILLAALAVQFIFDGLKAGGIV